MKKKLVALMIALTAVTAAVFGCGGKGDPVKNALQKDYSKIVTLGDYTGLEIDVESAEVTEKQMKEARESIISAMTTQEHVTDRAVKDKDKIHLQYTGYLDGKAFDNGSTGETGTDYTIGGNYIKDLNDQLIGLECGKEYDLDCTFPESFGNIDLAGKAVVFKVKVDYIYGDDIVPEWNDELAKSYSETYLKGAYNTVSELEKYMKDTLYENNVAQQQQLFESGLMATIVENCKISEIPEDRLKEITDSYYNYYKYQYQMYAAMYQMDYNSFLALIGQTEDDLKEMCAEQAEYSTQCIVVLNAIAAKEGITVSEEEYNEKASETAKEQGYKDTAEMEEALTREAIYEDFLNQKVVEFLKEKNEKVITDKSETEAETK